MAVPPPSPHGEAKAVLRARLRAARLAFVSDLGVDGVATAQDAMRRRLVRFLAKPRVPAHAGTQGHERSAPGPGLPPAREHDVTGPLAGYVAQPGEPDVRPVLLDAHREGRRIALPHIAAAAAMSFAEWRPDTVLTPGALGIAQAAEPVPITPAILLVPLLGFDRRGTRLGQGGGYYDRWLAAHPTARRIGVAWSVQEVDALPADPWDMPLHAIVTERDWIEPVSLPA